LHVWRTKLGGRKKRDGWNPEVSHKGGKDEVTAREDTTSTGGSDNGRSRPFSRRKEGLRKPARRYRKRKKGGGD